MAKSSFTFVAWLDAQRARADWIGVLAAEAARDRGLPGSTTPDQLRMRMNEAGADGDLFEALDAAELEWLAAA